MEIIIDKIDIVIEAFENAATAQKLIKGRELESNVLELKSGVSVDREFIDILGSVESENSYSIYNCNIQIDLFREYVNYTNCQCADFRKNNMFTEDAYICKHLAALTTKYIDVIIEENNLYDEEDEEEQAKRFIEKVEKKSNIKESLELEVFLEKNDHSYNFRIYNVYFKIGTKKKYILKNPVEFIEAKNNNRPLVFGKDFTYSNELYEFTPEDEKIIDYIEGMVALNRFSSGLFARDRLISGKHIKIPEENLNKFLEVVDGKEINFNNQKLKVVHEELPVELHLKKEDENYVLSLDEDSNAPLNKKGDVFIYKDKIYKIPQNQWRVMKDLYEQLHMAKKLKFTEDDEESLLQTVIPKLKEFTKELTLDESVKEIKTAELSPKFLLDTKGKDIIMKVELRYGDEVLSYFNEDKKAKIIRDKNKENEILNKLEGIGFKNKSNSFVFYRDDVALYEFLSEGYKALEVLGEVYYSDKFKERKVYNTPKIEAKIKANEDGYLNFSFNIEDIDSKQYKGIIDSFKNNKKFHKLKDNSFLSLEDKGIQDLMKFIEEIDVNSGNTKEIHKNKAVALSDFIEENNMQFIDGKDIVKNISEKISSFENRVYELPQDLNATLRIYQVIGYQWFKNLSELELGGVLADEMGLGKTLQAITFLLSEKGKNSLVVAPTSLVYNWKKEFEKFAPSIKIGIVHGTIDERKDIIKNYKDYDVLITTYGTLRNDDEDYKQCKFDYCIIDEAQNIKNYQAQVTKSVKRIKAKCKFALTGTPIENNLLELWSIFDFVMPGYLYNTTIFKERFTDGEDGIKNLQRFIRPFMLRRLKSEVIKELPEKIETRFFVELPKEQRDAYSTFVEEVLEKMESKDFEDDKITIFSYLTKLRQLCLDPKIILENYNGASGKMDAALELISEYLESNHKIILFSQFTTVLNNLGSLLKENNINYYYLDGSTKAIKRQELVDSFNNTMDTNIFLISLKAGGTGLNLTGADVVIHFDPWWNPSIEEQATDRAHRLGQKKVVEVVKLIAQGTIEEKIINLQDSKKELINNVMSGGYDSGNTISSLSTEELKELFIK